MKRANQELFWCHVSGRALEPADPHAGGIWTFEDLSAKRSVSPEMSAREREIAALIVDGKTSKLIARQLELSPAQSRCIVQIDEETAGDEFDGTH